MEDAFQQLQVKKPELQPIGSWASRFGLQHKYSLSLVTTRPDLNGPFPSIQGFTQISQEDNL